MGLIAKSKGGDFKMIPQGVQEAVCDMVVDLGVQTSEMYGDKEQVYLRFQVPSERVSWNDDGVDKEGPAVIGKFFTLSLNSKARLREFLENWRGRPFSKEEEAGFDTSSVAGVAGQLNIMHVQKSSGERAEISAIMPMGRRDNLPQVEGETIVFDTGNPHNIDKLPDWLRDIVEEGMRNRKTATVSAASDFRQSPDSFDDKIPF